MSTEGLTESLTGYALALGFELAGVCSGTPPETIEHYRQWIGRGHHASMGYLARSVDLRSSLDSILPGTQSVIAVGLFYNQAVHRSPGDPRIARYALGRDYHKVLRGKLRQLERFLLQSVPDAQCRACVDSAPVLEREYAQRAGLGWFGKNTCLIDSHRGSWFVIGLLLTTVPLTPSSAAMGGCGTCRRCVDACPTGAIVLEDGRWQIDSRRCVSYLTIEHKGAIAEQYEAGIGDWTFGCDVCQEVCPFNGARPSQPQRSPQTTEPDFLAVRAWPHLEELRNWSEKEWDLGTQGSPVRRAGYKGLRRNATINLRNRDRHSD